MRTYKVEFPDGSTRDIEVSHFSLNVVGVDGECEYQEQKPMWDIPGYEVAESIDGRYFAYKVQHDTHQP